MDARFHSDTQLESFKHDAEEGDYEVIHRDQGKRDVTILSSDNDEQLRALVYLNGGDVLDSPFRPGKLIKRRDGRKP